MLAIIILLTLSALLAPFRFTLAQEALDLGCFRLVPGEQPPGLDIGTSPLGYDCAVSCKTFKPDFYTYGYFMYIEEDFSWHCFCGTDAPPNQDYTNCANENIYQAVLAANTFTNEACYSVVHSEGWQTFLVDTMVECIAECLSSNWIVTNLVPNPSSTPDSGPITAHQLYCRCGGIAGIPPWERGTSVACDNVPNNFRIYPRNIMSPSEISRRKRRLDSELKTGSRDSLCPAGLTACNLPEGNGLTYECIDTNFELESCGGCINGPYSLNARSQPKAHHSHGTDCTAIPGVPSSAVTCSSGKCVAYGCDESAGFVLNKGRCITSE